MNRPHNIVGVQVTGSGDTKADNRETSRLWDLGCHSWLFCPHCGISICATASSDKKINSRGAHRLGDVDVFPGGIGMTVTASDDVNVDWYY